MLGEHRASDLQLGTNSIITAILLTQFVGIPFAILFGKLAGRIGTRAAITVSLVVYVGVCVFAAFLTNETQFLAMAVTVGMIQGGAQALTRSLYATLIPAHKSSEFFGLFVFASKVAGFGGPVLVAQGTNDRVSGPARAQERADVFERLRAGVTVRRIDGGHCPQDDTPEQVAERYVAWVEQALAELG